MNDESNLDDVLESMGLLDEEDGTIHTRLARRDIDSMFASPGGDDFVVPPTVRPAILPSNSLINNNPALRSTATKGFCELSAIKESSRDYSIFSLNTPLPASQGVRGGCRRESDNDSLYISSSSNSDDSI